MTRVGRKSWFSLLLGSSRTFDLTFMKCVRRASITTAAASAQATGSQRRARHHHDDSNRREAAGGLETV